MSSVADGYDKIVPDTLRSPIDLYCVFVYFSKELRTDIAYEIKQSKDALENAVRLSSDALQQATQIYDEALTLIASMKALSVPEIDLEKLRANALEALKEVFS